MRPLKFLLEVLPGPDIRRCGRGGVGFRLDIKAFHPSLETRPQVDHQSYLLPAPDEGTPAVCTRSPEGYPVKMLSRILPKSAISESYPANMGSIRKTQKHHLDFAPITEVHFPKNIVICRTTLGAKLNELPSQPLRGLMRHLVEIVH